jgi:hypothetical protein
LGASIITGLLTLSLCIVSTGAHEMLITHTVECVINLI